MPSPRTLSLIIIIILLWTFPESPHPISGKPKLDQAISDELAALNVLNSTRYHDFSYPDNRWLNLTGMRQVDGLAWDQLERVQRNAREHIFSAVGEEKAQKTIDGTLDSPLAVYKNITGYVRGSWIRSPLELHELRRPVLNLTALLPDKESTRQPFHRNITGAEGIIHLRFEEKSSPYVVDGRLVQTIRVDLTISDDNSAGDGWEMILHGEHFVDEGHLLLTTSSDKFAGIFALPHFALSEHFFGIAQKSLNKTLRETIDHQRLRKLFTLNPWDSSLEGHDSVFAAPNCEIIAYLQQYPLTTKLPNGAPTAVDPALVGPLENELRFPEGHQALTPPNLKMSMLMFSPDCGFIIESKGPPLVDPGSGNHLDGRKTELYSKIGRHHTLIYGAVLAAQVLLTIRQMKDSSTPSTRSRISFYTIAMLSLGDGFASVAFLLLGMFSDVSFPTLLATAFLAFLSATFFDIRFMMDIRSVQSQERRRQERQQQAAANHAATSTAPTEYQQGQSTPSTRISTTSTIPGTLPLPVTARQAISTGATPIILPADQDSPTQETPPTTTPAATEASTVRRELSTLYAKFCLTLLSIVFLSLHATSWYPLPRSMYANFIAFLYLSFWVPQIHRNTMRNCRKALLWKFVVGQSILRLTPFFYFWSFPDNFLFTRLNRHALLVLVGWVWVQVWVLVIQDIFGPRLFVPQSWVPPAYDYHPLLREDEEDAKMPIGFSQASSTSPEEIRSPTAAAGGWQAGSAESKDNKGKRIFDCAICMQSIEVPVIPASGSGSSGAEGAAGLAGNFLARRSYMVTPCRHIFHTQCLEAAMRYRLQCPICRETLPPL